MPALCHAQTATRRGHAVNMTEATPAFGALPLKANGQEGRRAGKVIWSDYWHLRNPSCDGQRARGTVPVARVGSELGLQLSASLWVSVQPRTG